MVATPAVRNLIREQAVEQIPTAIQTGSAYGMHSMDKSLQLLCMDGIVSYEDVIGHVKNLEEFRQMTSPKKK